MIILPLDLTSAEIRVLQEFRRLNTDKLTVDVVKAIKHPAGGGEVPAVALAAKGFLVADADGFVLTDRSREFLAIDARPMFEETTPSGASTAADAGAEDGA
jgi:hypothetical protein